MFSHQEAAVQTIPNDIEMLLELDKRKIKRHKNMQYCFTITFHSAQQTTKAEQFLLYDQLESANSISMSTKFARNQNTLLFEALPVSHSQFSIEFPNITLCNQLGRLLHYMSKEDMIQHPENPALLFSHRKKYESGHKMMVKIPHQISSKSRSEVQLRYACQMIAQGIRAHSLFANLPGEVYQQIAKYTTDEPLSDQVYHGIFTTHFSHDTLTVREQKKPYTTL